MNISCKFDLIYSICLGEYTERPYTPHSGAINTSEKRITCSKKNNSQYTSVYSSKPWYSLKGSPKSIIASNILQCVRGNGSLFFNLPLL